MTNQIRKKYSVNSLILIKPLILFGEGVFGMNSFNMNDIKGKMYNVIYNKYTSTKSRVVYNGEI